MLQTAVLLNHLKQNRKMVIESHYKTVVFIKLQIRVSILLQTVTSVN